MTSKNVKMSTTKTVPAHSAPQTHHYTIHYPPHPARNTDPHYVDFEHYHKLHRASARCYVGERIGFDQCLDAQGNLCAIDVTGEMSGLELHHAHVEFSLQNGIDLKALEKDFPGISDATTVGAWVESDANFRWLCTFHHRAAGGAHTASHSDWEAGQYVPGLISKSTA
jgi:hypothetical protein